MIYKFSRLRFSLGAGINQRRISNMAIVRFRPYGNALDPFRDFSDVQSEMNRLFDSFVGRPGHAGSGERIWVPGVDMHETPDHLVVTMDLPGLNEKDIDRKSTRVNSSHLGVSYAVSCL